WNSGVPASSSRLRQYCEPRRFASRSRTAARSRSACDGSFRPSAASGMKPADGGRPTADDGRRTAESVAGWPSAVCRPSSAVRRRPVRLAFSCSLKGGSCIGCKLAVARRAAGELLAGHDLVLRLQRRADDRLVLLGLPAEVVDELLRAEILLGLV